MNAKYLKTKLTQGFSLVELMVVVAIIALLTAIAVPSYKTYIAQSQVADIFALASDQMTQQAKNRALGGAAFDIVTTPTGNAATYITTMEIVGNCATSGCTGTTITPVPTGAPATTNGSLSIPAWSNSVNAPNGYVAMQLVSPNPIDTTNLSGIVKLYWIPTYVSTESGDLTDQNVVWTCYYDAVNVPIGNSTGAGCSNTVVAQYFAVGNSGSGCTCFSQ